MSPGALHRSLFEQVERQRTAIACTAAYLDGTDNVKYQIQNRNGQEKDKSDKYKTQNRGDNVSNHQGDLKIKSLPGLSLFTRIYQWYILSSIGNSVVNRNCAFASQGSGRRIRSSTIGHNRRVQSRVEDTASGGKSVCRG